MTFRHCVAVDLGASSGRVMLARYDSEHRTLTLREIHRFVNCLQKTDGFDTWDIDSLENDIRLGLKKVCDEGIRIDSIGIDTWGVDYVLVDNAGQRVGLPISYRDNRTTGIMSQAMVQPGKNEIYRRSGIQFLPFNTLYQLRALVEQQPELLPQVAHALLIPDYFSFRLTGEMNWEYTNATTTQLVNINTDDWDDTLLAWTGQTKPGLVARRIRGTSLATGFARRKIKFRSWRLPVTTRPARSLLRRSPIKTARISLPAPGR